MVRRSTGVRPTRGRLRYHKETLADAYFFVPNSYGLQTYVFSFLKKAAEYRRSGHCWPRPPPGGAGTTGPHHLEPKQPQAVRAHWPIPPRAETAAFQIGGVSFAGPHRLEPKGLQPSVDVLNLMLLATQIVQKGSEM